ncbi:MAG: sodium:solute symporter family protein [Candidatus Nezhaarchaeota archaeon]|nr:sodium:solute symporter family protein [Candidatus Nezhaarchaeota archaeon]
MDPITVLVSIIAFLALCFFIAHQGKLRTERTIEDYFIAGRRIGSFIAAMTYSATTYSAFMMVGLVGLTAIHGVGALGFELVYLMGLMLAVLLGLRFYVAGKKWNIITPAQLLTERYGSPLLGMTVAILYHVFLIPYMAAQLIGVGVLVSGLTNNAIPFEIGALLVIVATLAYTLWGGMRAVAWTDTLQAIVMLASSLTMLFIAFQLAGGVGAVFEKLAQDSSVLGVPGPHNRFTLIAFISMTVPWFFFCVSNPQVVQRFYIPKSVRALRNMIGGFLIFGFIYTVIVTLLGLVAHILVPHIRDPNMVTPTLLTMIWEPIAILVLLGILAASISTLDSIMLALSSEFAMNVVKVVRPRYDELKALKISRAFMIVIVLATIVFSFTRGFIVELAVMSSSWLLQFVPAFIAALVWKRANKISAYASIVVGVAVTGMLTLARYTLQPDELSSWMQTVLQLDPGVWGLLAATLTLLAFSVSTKTDERGQRFVKEIEEALRELLK